MTSLAVREEAAEATAAALMAKARARVNFTDLDAAQPDQEQPAQVEPWQMSHAELDAHLDARQPQPLPDYWEDVQRHLHTRRQEVQREARQRNAERLAELMTATDWTDADAEQAAQFAAQARAAREEATVPRVTVRAPQQATAAELLADALPVSAQARALFEELHRLATLANHHAGTPRAGQGVVYTSQELLGVTLDRSAESVRRYANELQAAGLVTRRDHYATLRGRTVTGGTLYAVQLRLGHAPRLRYSDLSRQYRNLDAAKASGTTFFSYLQHLWVSHTREERVGVAQCVLSHFAVNPDRVPRPVEIDTHKTPGSVWDVVYSLSDLARLSGARLAEAIGRSASELAHALHDEHSRRYWCAQLWQATRAGRLGQLTAALERLLHDAEEWHELRNPAALFAARMRPTV